MGYAPVVLFCYNRPDHLEKTVNSLRRNQLASQSPLFVFLDGNKGAEDAESVAKVRAVADRIYGFREVTVVKSESNQGLAHSVIAGVSQVLESYPYAIIMEDDLLTTPDFLSFMNNALEVFRDRKEIFSVTGYAPPFQIPGEYKEDIYLAPRSSSWGWGTWKDRWEKAEWGGGSFERLKKDPELKARFLSGGSDLWPMLYKQQQGFIDSWAVRWCFSQAVYGGYGVYPVRSKVQNFGTDGTGTNFTFKTQSYEVALDERSVKINPELRPDKKVLDAFRRFYDSPLWLRLKNLLKFGLRY